MGVGKSYRAIGADGCNSDATLIPGIKNLASQFADTIYPEILDELDAARPISVIEPTLPGTDPNPDLTSLPAPAKQTVSIKKLALPGAGQVL